MAEKKGISHLIRQVGQQIRIQEAEKASGDTAKIFNILDYIEQPWGLAMKLYPAQRFLVKLYYNLELDTHIPKNPNDRIQITDMFKTKVLYELSERDYLKFLYNEGRCNIGEQDHDRRELVLPIGRRGGKCVDGDSLVLTDRGVFRIEELGEAPEEDFSASSIGVVQENSRRSVATAFYNGGIQQTFKVTTASGYTITGTGNHRIKVMGSSGKVEWVYLDQLRLGAPAAINRNTDLWPTELVDLKPYHNEDGRKETPLPDFLDEAVANLMGYLVGDGTWGNTQGVSVTVEHPETWVYLKSLFQQVGCERDAKMIPWSILRSPKKVVCAFLRGLFETDGCAEDGGRDITFSSASFRLAHEVQTLLLNMGILSSVLRKWNPQTKKHYAYLRIKGVRSRKEFARLIGFDSEKKRLPMLSALETATEDKSNTESIPHQYNRLRDWLESVPKRNASKGTPGWGRMRLRVTLGNSCKPRAEDLTYPRLQHALGVAKELGAGEAETAHFEELLGLDYFYDPVVSIEKGENQVYDLTVPDGASFVANGFTNHNTTLSGIFASYEVYRLLNLHNPQEYYGLPNGNRILITAVATGKDQASILFNEVTSHLAKCEYFKPYIASNTLSHVNFRTPYDIERFGTGIRHSDGKYTSLNGKASLRVTFKAAIAKSLRGPGNIVIIMDEVAHFQDKGGSSADEIYQAIVPSSATFSRKDPETGRPLLDPGGREAEVESRIIMISSPLGRSGKFYERFDLAMRGGDGARNILAIQAPTWEINPTVPSAYYKEKYHEDPVEFMTEHGAQFSDQARGWIERETDLQACISPTLRPKVSAVPRMPHQMGVDIAMVNDGTAMAVTHADNGKIVLDYHEVWYAGKDWKDSNPHLEGRFSTDYAKTLSTVERLDFDEIATWIETVSKKFHITAGLFDRWSGLPLEQALHKKGLRQFQSEFFTRDQTSKMYQTVKMFIFDEKIVLYDYPIPERTKNNVRHSPLIAELLSLQAKQLSKNIIIVEAPTASGAHDDMSDALIRAIWLSIQTLLNQKHTAYGTPYRPQVATSLTPSRYQRIRARTHGVNPRMRVR